VFVIIEAHHLYDTGFQSLIESDLIIEINLSANSTGILRAVHESSDRVDVFSVRDILRNTSLDLRQGRVDDNPVHFFDLFIDPCEMVTRVVDEDHTHDTIEVIGVLIVDGDTRFVPEGLTNPTLEKILVKIRKKQRVEGCLTLFEGIKVEVLTHLI
jgi:hypothetical protein